jgi:tight adherence protein C
MNITNSTQLLFLLLVFLVVFGGAVTILLQLGGLTTQKRLDDIAANQPEVSPSQEMPVWVRRVIKLSGPLAQLVVPQAGWENSSLRYRFMYAGYRLPTAPVLFFTFKIVLALVLPGLLALYFTIFGMPEVRQFTALLSLLVATTLGYYLPNVWLHLRIKSRQLEIFETFPDALDLMMVCVEAGLALDAALDRVGREIRLKSTVLADELHLVSLEMRAGSSRERALRNLALRTGVAEVSSLVALLVQSDRFGTSVANSLRVHSEGLRTKRRLRAEEAAAKIPVKMLFPLILCIFPALMLVLMGPSFISIYRVLLPALAGTHVP